jgi:hypothetical protein
MPKKNAWYCRQSSRQKNRRSAYWCHGVRRSKQGGGYHQTRKATIPLNFLRCRHAYRFRLGLRSQQFVPIQLGHKELLPVAIDKQLDEIVVSGSVSKSVQKAQVSSFMVRKDELLTMPSLASESDLNFTYR